MQGFDCLQRVVINLDLKRSSIYNIFFNIFFSIFFVANTCKPGVKYNLEEAVKAASLYIE
jgi:hypothetical protein